MRKFGVAITFMCLAAATIIVIFSFLACFGDLSAYHASDEDFGKQEVASGPSENIFDFAKSATLAIGEFMLPLIAVIRSRLITPTSKPIDWTLFGVAVVYVAIWGAISVSYIWGGPLNPFQLLPVIMLTGCIYSATEFFFRARYGRRNAVGRC